MTDQEPPRTGLYVRGHEIGGVMFYPISAYLTGADIGVIRRICKTRCVVIDSDAGKVAVLKYERTK